MALYDPGSGEIKIQNNQGFYRTKHLLTLNSKGIPELYVGSIRFPKRYEGCRFRLHVEFIPGIGEEENGC